MTKPAKKSSSMLYLSTTKLGLQIIKIIFDNMKKSFKIRQTVIALLTLITMSLSSCAQTIGYVEKDQFKLTTEISEVKWKWEEMLEKQKNPAILTNFEIKKNNIKGTGEIYYMLLATNAEKTIKVAHLLDLKGNQFSLQSKRVGDHDIPIKGGTCVCSGCSAGCDPALTEPGGNFICTSCSQGTNCNKSVTVVITQ